MFTRLQFDQAAKALIKKHSSRPALANTLLGWSWHEHPSVPRLGYMSRITIHSRKIPSYDEEHDIDEATALPSVAVECLTCQQYIVYSPTFRVPVFYFSIHDSNGSPLPLTELVRSTLFHAFGLEGTEATTFALTLPASAFPVLSQGDHPTLGSPCWYLHPCETARAVEEIMCELVSEDEGQLRRLEVWFMVVGSVVNMSM